MTPINFAAVMDAGSRDDLLAELLRHTARLEFDKVSASVIIDAFDGGLSSFCIDNVPVGYRATFEDTSVGRRDPVSQHCRLSSYPIVWDRSTYVAGGAADQWEFQARFGFHAGIALGLHFPHGRHLFIGMDRDGPMPSRSEEVARLMADFCLLAIFVQESAMRLLSPGDTPTTQVNLTQRERETLRWTMEGKTAWEVGAILNISEQTAARHLSNASRKLDCVSKHHAVVKALRLGLIR